MGTTSNSPARPCRKRVLTPFLFFFHGGQGSHDLLAILLECLAAGIGQLIQRAGNFVDELLFHRNVPDGFEFVRLSGSMRGMLLAPG